MKRIRFLALTLLAVVPFVGSNAQTCDLYKKVKEGDITAVRNMLDAGCAVDAKNSSGGWIPLHGAAYYNRVEIAKLLIDAGANVDIQDNDRYGYGAALHLAAAYYRAEIAQLLLDADANVDLQNSWGATPLYRASFGETLSISASKRREDTVRVLLDANANAKLRDPLGMTPLHWAVWVNVLDETSVLWQDAYGVVIRMLVDAGADVDAKDNDGKTPLHWASHSKRPVDVVRALVEAGADINAKDNDGQTPLHSAANKSDIYGRSSVDVVRALVDFGADVNAKDNNGQTPLHFAANKSDLYGRSSVDAVRALVEFGADINAQNDDGNTPLHVASMGGKADAIRVLLELGADDRIKNNAKLKPKAVGSTKEVRKLLKTPGLYWPIKAYAIGNASSNLVETSARVGCADKKDCRVFLECTDKDGDEFKGSLDSASKEATDEDSISRGVTVSLSASEIKTITGVTGDGALDCALRSHQRITAQVWSSTDSVNANTTAYWLSEDNEARIQFKVGESNTPFVNIRCLAAKGERCTKTKLVCTDDSGRDWPKIKAGTIDRLNVYTVSTVKGADHRIDDDDTGWYSCDVSSENPFMVYATHFSIKGDSRSLINTTAVSTE